MEINVSLNEFQNHKLKLMEILKSYVPFNALELCCELIIHYRLNLHIEVERKTKFGDYQYLPKSKSGRITVNHNLNPYEFLFTFIHELAHHTTFLKYGNSIDAHGTEWKNEFKQQMFPFLQKDIFPNVLKFAIIAHMKNPKYSHSADPKLHGVLMQFDTKKNYTTLNDLNEGEKFKLSIKSRQIFIKQNPLRTYTVCKSVINDKLYKVPSLAKVIKV